jgi:carbamoyl-phosphate synthase large subunit
VAVKVPVFPFNKFHESDPRLGPEMRSTGEVMGIAEAFPEAYAKAILGAGHKLPTSGQVFISVADRDKARVVEVARAYLNLGFSLMATEGTAALLQREGLSVRVVRKKIEGSPNAEDMIREGLIHLVINTPVGEEALRVDSAIRKAAVIYNVPMAATIDGALAMAKAIQSQHETVTRVSSLQSLYSCGNLSAFS